MHAPDTPNPPTCHASALAEHADAIRKLGKRVVGDVTEIGRRLTQCKKLVGHGNWLLWLDREFGWTEKTAERFMSVHALAGKFDNLSNLELPLSGLYLLAAPSTPQEARDEIIERAEAGEKLPVDEINRTVKKHKGRKRRARSQLNGMLRADRRQYLEQQGERGGTTKGFRKYVRNKYVPAESARDDVGPTSTQEVARKGAEIEQLHNDKRRLEIKITGLQSEIAELKNASREPASATRCEICREKKRAVPRRVFVCDRCAEIHELETRTEVAPRADDGLDIPACLRREVAP